MKERSKLAKLFLPTRIVVDVDKLNYKEKKFFFWNRLVKALMQFYYWILYNVAFSLTWVHVVQTNTAHNHSVITTIGVPLTYVALGTFHIGANIVHWIGNKLGRDKTQRDYMKSGNAVPKISTTSKVFLLVSIVPLTIWLIGSLVIWLECRKYKKENGNWETEEMRRAYMLDETAVVAKAEVQAKGEVIADLAKTFLEANK